MLLSDAFLSADFNYTLTHVCTMYIYVNLVKYLKWLPHFLTQFFCPWRTSVGGRISFCWYILFLTVNTFLLSTTFLSFDAFLLADAFLMKRRTAVSSNSCGMTVSALPLALLIFFLLLTYCLSLTLDLSVYILLQYCIFK